MPTEKSLVLIVDDNSQNLQVIGGILKNSYRIAMAKSGEQALEALKDNVPDAILLDIMMPVMDGYELCTRIKKIENLKEIPVIFVTAKKETEDLVKGFEAGGVDYITKPIIKEELLVRLKNHIELKKAKDMVSLQAMEMGASNKVKDKLFSIISHDLRGPVANLKMYIAGIVSGRINLNDKEIIDSFAKTVDETYFLVDNLLNWARQQQKKIQVYRSDIWLKDIVDLNFALYASSAVLKNISMKNSIPENTKVSADENMLKTILRNLINNSIKFTHQGGSIEISFSENEEFYNIALRDTGVGMNLETAEKLFDEKIIISTDGTGNEKGSGLGLSIVKSFVKMHNGEIWVKSQIGVGSTFYFTLSKQEVEGNE